VQSQGVAATVKHFVANNSEVDRDHTDSRVDERTLREIYMPAFEAAVKEAQVGAVMDSYNLVNGVQMSANGALNIGVLKKEWGFPGLLMSDWFSTYDGVAAALGGLDIEMPYAKAMKPGLLLAAIKDGRIPPATIDDKVRRLLRVGLRFGFFERQAPDPEISRYSRSGREAALQGAREGIVLLKNEGPLLPVARKDIRSILVVGWGAHPAVWGGGGSSMTEPFTSVSLIEGLTDKAGEKIQVHYAKGVPTVTEMVAATRFITTPMGGEPGIQAEYFAKDDLSGTPVLSRVETRVDVGSRSREHTGYPAGTLSERWSGFYLPKEAGTYDVFVTSSGDKGGLFRLYLDDKLVLDNWEWSRHLVDSVTLPLDARPLKVVLEHRLRPKWPPPRLELGFTRHGGRVEEAAKALAKKVDLVVVASGFDATTESEGSDRTFAMPPGQDELIQEMAAANKNVAVVLFAGGAVDMTAWIDRVPAVLQAWYPGQEGGLALAEILLGDVNPSGKLPATFERRFEDNPSYASYYPEAGSLRIPYKEGVFVGYRGFEKNNVKPLFPFGHGLSYTTFEYANLTVTPEKTKDGRVEVSFDVKNTGARAGAEVAQVYVGDAHAKVPRPPKELKGFAKLALEPGETRRATVALDARSFSYYDVASKSWRADPGSFDILVGGSSANIRLRGKVALGRIR
jgi:beta-glucosidase